MIETPFATPVGDGYLTLAGRARPRMVSASQAVAQGDSPSLETIVAFAEQRQEILQAELAQPDGSAQPTVVQLRPAALERHLQGMIEKSRSHMTGGVREVIQQSIARILNGVDGSPTIEAKVTGLLGEKELMPA